MHYGRLERSLENFVRTDTESGRWELTDTKIAGCCNTGLV